MRAVLAFWKKERVWSAWRVQNNQSMESWWKRVERDVFTRCDSQSFVSVPVSAHVVAQSGDCRDIILVSRVSHLNCRWTFRRQTSVADSGVAVPCHGHGTWVCNSCEEFVVGSGQQVASRFGASFSACQGPFIACPSRKRVGLLKIKYINCHVEIEWNWQVLNIPVGGGLQTCSFRIPVAGMEFAVVDVHFCRCFIGCQHRVVSSLGWDLGFSFFGVISVHGAQAILGWYYFGVRQSPSIWNWCRDMFAFFFVRIFWHHEK